jgi:hypothetical protein
MMLGSLGHRFAPVWLGLGRVGCYQHLARPTIFLYRIFMAKSISRTGKKSRGRPRRDPTSIHLTLLPDQLSVLDLWITKQREPDLSRPEAIRRMLNVALGRKIPH